MVVHDPTGIARDRTVLVSKQIAFHSVAGDAEGVDQNQGFFAK